MFTQKHVFVAISLFTVGSAILWSLGAAPAQVTVEQSPEQAHVPPQLIGLRSPTGETVIQGGDGSHPTFVVLVSPDRTKAWGYSTEKGEWVKAPLRAKLASELPVTVGLEVGVISEGRYVHAFSSLKGEWQTLELPEGTNADPIVGTDDAQVRTKDAISIFSAQKGNWSTVKFAE